MPPNRSPLRDAYSLIEILMVISVIGIISAISFPKLAKLKDQAQLTGATTRFARAVMTARQAAIQRGRRSYFRHSSSSVWVIVDTTSSDSVIVVSPFSLESEYGVKVVSPSGVATIEYDPRGVSTQPSKQVFAFKHTNSGSVDSLCVTRLGNTIRQSCP